MNNPSPKGLAGHLLPGLKHTYIMNNQVKKETYETTDIGLAAYFECAKLTRLDMRIVEGTKKQVEIVFEKKGSEASFQKLIREYFDNSGMVSANEFNGHLKSFKTQIYGLTRG